MTTINSIINNLRGMICLADTLTPEEIKQVGQVLIEDLQEYQQLKKGTTVCPVCSEKQKNEFPAGKSYVQQEKNRL